ncbi:MAG: Wzz/FepE/Etk N-terminal domain-containing protein [bacterium]
MKELPRATLDEEIDLVEVLKFIYSQKGVFVIILILSLLVGSFIPFFIPKTYTSSCTFFNIGARSQPSPLSAYSTLLGVASSDSGKLQAIIESYRLKSLVATHFLKDFENELDAFYDNHQNKDADTTENRIRFIVGSLQLEKNITLVKQKNDTYLLSYTSESPDLSYRVLNTYLTSLEDIYRLLDLSVHKEIIRLLDTPTLPSSPSSPNSKKILKFSFMGSFVLFGVYLLGVYGMRLVKTKL